MTDSMWAAMITGGSAVLAALITGGYAVLIVKINKNHDITSSTHDLVNSRMTELLALARTSSRAEGVKEEQEREK